MGLCHLLPTPAPSTDSATCLLEDAKRNDVGQSYPLRLHIVSQGLLYSVVPSQAMISSSAAASSPEQLVVLTFESLHTVAISGYAPCGWVSATGCWYKSSNGA
jgi:hypothetical protein